MALQHEGGRATQSSEFAIGRCGEPRRRAGEHGCSDLLFNQWSDARPRRGDVPDDQHNLRRERRCDQSQTASECAGLPLERGERLRIPFFAKLQQILYARHRLLRVEFFVVAQRGLAGGKGLPASALTTAANGTVGINGNVSELACETTASGENLSVGEDRGA